MKCPECRSEHIRKNGMRRGKQNHICVSCPKGLASRLIANLLRILKIIVVTAMKLGNFQERVYLTTEGWKSFAKY